MGLGSRVRLISRIRQRSLRHRVYIGSLEYFIRVALDLAGDVNVDTDFLLTLLRRIRRDALVLLLLIVEFRQIFCGTGSHLLARGLVVLDRAALRVLHHLNVRGHVGLRLELTLGDAVDVLVLRVVVQLLVRVARQVLRRVPLLDQHHVLRVRSRGNALLRD